jgi:hypothetical protein
MIEPQNYPVWKEEGKLNVYDRPLTGSAPFFKFNEMYYEIGFVTP